MENKIDKNAPAKMFYPLALLILPPFSVLIFILLTPFVLLETWALHNLYTWFVQPLGTPGISYWQMLGLVMFGDLLKLSYVDLDKDKSGFDFRKRFTSLVVKMSVILILVFVGWLVKGWM